MDNFTDSAGYGGSGAGMALFKQFLTLLGGAGYGGTGAGSLQAVLGSGVSGSSTLQAVLNFSRWCGLRRV
jgi:hypothetical protein